MWYKINEDKTVEKLPDGEYPTDKEYRSPHRRVGDDLVDGQRVSTVFLGFDHNWGGDQPVLFETMIFDGPYDQHMWRYHTYDEALTGHNKVVDVLKKGLNPTIVLK